MLIFLIIMLSLVTYGSGFGITYRTALNGVKSRCDRCKDGEGRYCSSDHEVSAFFFAALWPVGLPALITMKGIGNGEDKAETRRKAELKQAEHERDLARIKAEETDYLDRQLSGSQDDERKAKMLRAQRRHADRF